MTREITIPYAPRQQQREIHKLIDAHRFGCIVTHRRFGKTVLGVNHLIKGALTCQRERPRFGLIEPTYRQAKQVAWDYVKHYSNPIPNRAYNESELRVTFPNGGEVRLFGADNPDALRGVYFDGVILDEYGLMRPNVFSEVIRPALSDRQGWALFSGTPNGKNQFWEIAEYARTATGWFFRAYPASATQIISAEELSEAKRVMTADEYLQEYECSFEASVRGAIYATELRKAREENRICQLPYEPALKVSTYWDLGIGDYNAIWFAQFSGAEVRLIDYYEANGEGLAHYCKVLSEKPYIYGTHNAPHDIMVKELGSGRTRYEVAQSLGINFVRVPDLPIEDGVNAARTLFPRIWIDSTRCQAGLEALMSYRWDYNARLDEFKPVPVHDWASHGADALRYLAVSYLPTLGEQLGPRDRYARKKRSTVNPWTL